MREFKKNGYKKNIHHPLIQVVSVLKTLVFSALVSCFYIADVYADEYYSVTQLIREEQFNKALLAAEQSLAAKPFDPQMRFIKGVIQTKVNHVADAIATFSNLTKDYPHLPEPHNNLAVLYARQGQLDKARASLEMAVRTRPDYITAYENLGDIHNQLAIHFYQKTIQLDKNNINVQTKLKLANDLFVLQKTIPKD